MRIAGALLQAGGCVWHVAQMTAIFCNFRRPEPRAPRHARFAAIPPTPIAIAAATLLFLVRINANP
jgi:hypothetical protein